MKIEFVDAVPKPQTGKSKASYQTIARQLKDRPSEWALVLRGVSSGTATLIKKGGYLAFQPAGSFEAAARKSKSGGKNKSDIYARFVGETEDES